MIHRRWLWRSVVVIGITIHMTSFQKHYWIPKSLLKSTLARLLADYQPGSPELITNSSLNCTTETLVIMWSEFIMDITVHATLFTKCNLVPRSVFPVWLTPRAARLMKPLRSTGPQRLHYHGESPVWELKPCLHI